MREIQIDSFGGPDVLALREADAPTPGPGEVLVRVAFAGLNPLDYKLRDGSSGKAGNLQLPAVLGREAAGTVLSTADDVDLEALGMPRGTAVFGMRAMDDWRGTYAEVIAIPAAHLAPVRGAAAETGASASDAGSADASSGTGSGSGTSSGSADAPADPLAPWGGLALTGLTALAAVRNCARVRPGDTVLIHGGTGGVGQMLIPLALEAGAARIWATGRAENGERLRTLGAEPIAYDEQDWQAVIREATDGRGVDVILDTHYFETFEPSLDHLAPGGRIVVMPTLADLAPAKERGIDASIPALTVDRERLEHLAAGMESGALDVEIAAVLPPEQIAEAHRHLESGHTRGKLLLDLRGRA